jgi:lipoate---protein ligase
MPGRINILHLKNQPIYTQLQIEEALLRQNKENWCVINEGTPPSIVMGISGKKEELICADKMAKAPLPLIKRFSGGGTVVVDETTLFVTFICQKELHDFALFPEPIMRWSEGLYKEVFDHPLFRLRENDYVIGEKKCGGNAQYIKKERWLHHTSFLWDYQSSNMDYLLMPRKTPTYREGRTHTDFLCKLSQHFPSKEEWIAKLKERLAARYTLCPISVEETSSLCSGNYRRTTSLLA